MSLIDYSQTKRPVFEIDLDLAPYDRWQEVGRRQRARLGRFLGDIRKMAEEHAEAWLKQFSKPKQPLIRSLLRGGVKVTGPLAVFVARIFGEEYQEEIRGLAHASGHDLNTLFLANLMYDISVGLAALPTACSSFSTTLDDTPVLVRTMDWALPRSTGKYTFITRFGKGRNSYVNIAPLGCVGVLSAMRTGAWAVTLNQAPPNGLPRILQWPAMHRLRAACDASLGYASLVRRIREQQTMTSFFAHAVGTKAHEQTVIEHVAETSHIRKVRPEGHLIQTNHFTSKKYKHLNPRDDGCMDADSDYQCWRYYELEKKLKKQAATLRGTFGKLSPVTHEDTMNSMILRPADGASIVRVRELA
jgi:hypothetical protein